MTDTPVEEEFHAEGAEGAEEKVLGKESHVACSVVMRHGTPDIFGDSHSLRYLKKWRDDNPPRHI